jgi:hypothetical protein
MRLDLVRANREAEALRLETVEGVQDPWIELGPDAQVASVMDEEQPV